MRELETFSHTASVMSELTWLLYKKCVIFLTKDKDYFNHYPWHSYCYQRIHVCSEDYFIHYPFILLSKNNTYNTYTKNNTCLS